MPRDKRDESLLPVFDIARLIRDLGGIRALSERMARHGASLWGIKTLQVRQRKNNLSVERLLELMHVQRLEGRPINPNHYITWSPACQYPSPSSPDLPQPVPVSQRQE